MLIERKQSRATIPVATVFATLLMGIAGAAPSADKPLPGDSRPRGEGEIIDFTGFDIYASEGYVLTHRYRTEDGDALVRLDTTDPGVTREIHADGTITAYQTLKAAKGQIILEQVTDFDAEGGCQSTHKTRYQWIATFPASAREGDQLQRIASVTDFDHERPCGTSDRQRPVVESVIKVVYTVLGRTAYEHDAVKLDNCVKLTEQAPDYSGIATLCAGVGTAYRMRTGAAFGRNERTLLAVEQPAAQELKTQQ